MIGPFIPLRDTTIVHVTKQALLVEVDKEEIWFPRSVVAGGEDFRIGDKGEITVRDWFLEEIGLIDPPEDICPFCGGCTDCECSPADFGLEY